MTRLSVLPLEPRDTPAFINAAFAQRFAVGGTGLNAAAQLVRFQADNSLAVDLSVVPYPGFAGEVRVASADVTGDGVIDLVTAAGAGGGPHVKVFDGDTGAEVRSFFAYDFGFTGGVNVAAADVTGDRRADVITGAGAGGGPHVKVFDANTLAEVWSFFPFDPNFRGGVSVAGGDMTLDGFAEITVAAGPGGGPHVRVLDGRTLGGLQSFYAFDPGVTAGVNVAMGDVNNDTRADLVFAQAGRQFTTQFGLFGVGPLPPTAQVSITQNPFRPSGFGRALDPFGAGYAGGIRVGSADADGDGREDALFATPDGQLRAVFARDLLSGNELFGSILTTLPLGGLFVG